MSAQPNTLGAFGNVINIGSDRHSPSRTAGDYLRLAGGFTSGANDNSSSLVWINRSIYNSLPVSDVPCRGRHVADMVSEHGNTTFLPEGPDKGTWVHKAKNSLPTGHWHTLQRVSFELKVGRA